MQLWHNHLLSLIGDFMSEATLPDLATSLPISDLTLPPTAKDYPRSTTFASFFKSLWERICSISTKIFSSISHFCSTNFCSPKDFFSSREVTLLRDERLKAPIENPVTENLKDKIITIETVDSTEELKVNAEPAYLSFDPSLENLRSFIRDFSTLGIDVFYETNFINHIESAQHLAPSLPPFIKSIAKLLVEMGDKAAKPLFKKFAEQKAQTIDPALQKIFKTLLKPDINELKEKLSLHLNQMLEQTSLKENQTPADYINPILKWLSLPEGQKKPLKDLCSNNKKIDFSIVNSLFKSSQDFWNEEHNNERKNLYDSLKEILDDEFKETKIPLKISLEADYIEPVLEWLLLSNHTMPLTDLFKDLTPQKEELLDKIFERSISLLVEKKIDEYSHMLEKIMQRRLGEIVQHAMQKNAARIADFFSERISELINAMSFKDTFDALIHDTLHLQIQGIIESENHFEESRQTLEKSYHIAQIEPKTVEAVDAQIRAQNHLKTVEMYGGAEAYLQMTYMEKLREHPSCSQHLKQVIDQEKLLIQQGKDPRVVKSSIEKALYATIAENFLNLMTPTRKKLDVNGEVIEIDPFLELWDRLYLPEEFHDLIKQSGQLTQEFVTPEMTFLMEKIKQPSLEIIKSFFKSTTKDLLRKKIEEIVKDGFENITIPEKLNELNAETTFPSINLLLIETLAGQVVEKNIKEFAPMFYEMLASDQKDRNHHLKTIQHSLIKLTKGKFNLFNPLKFYTEEEKIDNKFEIKTSGLSPHDWFDLTENVIQEIEKKILNSKVNQFPFNPSNTSLKEVTELLKKSFTATPVENNKKFGTLSTDLIFKLGKFSSEWLISFFLKDSLSASLSESVQPWRESHSKFIETIAGSLRKKLLNRETLKKLLEEKQEVPSSVTEEKLAMQIEITASLAHDLIMGLAQEKGILQAYAVRKILTSGPGELTKVITNIYQRLFGNRSVNQNLVILATEKVFKSLSTASDNIKLQENMLTHQLAAEYKK